jgi:hypothetical protein
MDSGIYANCATAKGLFDPGDIPNPTVEKWLKNLEPWETPAKGTKHAVQYNE